MSVDPILSPSARIASGGGPIHTILFFVAASSSGSRSFSLACPQPGQTACTPVRSAMSTISRMLA